MWHNKFKIEDIEIGGKVYFDNEYVGKFLVRNNHDEHWIVTGKDGNLILVSLKNQFYETIDIADISYYERPL